MITLKQMELIDKEAGRTVEAKLRKKRLENESQITLSKLEAEDEALIAYFESDDEVEVLLDEVEHTSKPQGKEVGRITKALPNNRVKVAIPQFANFIERGCSFKASVLTSTTKDSFVSSNIVALDVDNKESYTTIDEFMKLTGEAQLKPFMMYETFSSTGDHQRFRVLYRFNRTITDSEEMEKLYNYVWSLFPTVDLDYSVDHSKILYGGKKVVFFNNETNDIPDLSNVSILKKKTVKAAPKQTTATHTKHITKEEIKANLEALRAKYEGQVMNAKEINENIKLTDLLGVSLGERFRCILPNHDDKNPSARIIEDKNNPKEQVYICTCNASGNRVINIWAKLFNVSNTVAFKQISSILGTLMNSEYQRKAKDFIDTLYDNYDVLMDDEVKRILDKKRLTHIYLLFLRIARSKAVAPISKNENDIAVYVSNEFIKDRMVKEKIAGARDINKKINELCRLGIIKKLTDSEIKPASLAESKKDAKYNHIDYYCILDLTEDRINFIKDTVAHDKEVGYRQYGTNTQRQINACGHDHIRGNVHTQAYRKKEDQSVIAAVNTLIESGTGYFSEDDVSKLMRQKNHKLVKKVAEQRILDFMPSIVESLGLKRIRVNKKTRKTFNIDKKYASNSIIYIVSKSEDIEYLENIL